MRSWLAFGLCLLGWAFTAGAARVEDVAHRRVLFLYSFGPNFAPFDEFASGLRAELSRTSTVPIEFFEASLETARFSQTDTEEPLAAYLSALFRESGIDLVITVGGPAARFCFEHRDQLFPATPLLMAGMESRFLRDANQVKNAASITVVLDLPGAIDNILRVLPDTNEIVIVMGGSSLDRFWIEELQREFERFAQRVRFSWLNDLSLVEMEERVASLPPQTAVFFGSLSVDAAGVPHEHDYALDRLYAASTAPIFGLYDVQLGRGIVGGPLLPVPFASRRAAETALQLLRGETTDRIDVEPLGAGAPLYDSRELERWGIPESRLPAGSEVRFRPISPWSRYRGPILLGLGLVGLQTALIGTLAVQRSRLRHAEGEARALSRRLLTAHEDERRRLARELHDDVSQRLARLAIDAAQVAGQSKGTAAEATARAMREDSMRLGDDLHALSYRLHPSVLDDLGLGDALQAECALFSRRESVHVTFDAVGVPPELPSNEALCLFRIAQEALRNVVRHASASRAEITLQESRGGILLTVRDDGEGFDPAERRKLSLGHASMRERVRLVQGTLEIVSSRGKGTTVKAWVPFEGRT